MEIKSKVSQAFTQFSDSLQEQVWFQQLKAKWEELDPQSRFYLQIATLGSAVVGAIAIVSISLWGVYSLKRDYQQKNELLSQLQSANDELKRLRDAAPMPEGEEAAAWGPYLEGIASSAGLDPTKMKIGGEAPGAKSDLTQETLIEVTLEKINAKQLVRYATQIESGSRPLKLRNLSIDTDPDLSGYLTARFHLSGFQVIAGER